MTTTVDHATSTIRARPGFEGANIRTWVGFKHFTYLVEEAVLQWFRDRAAGPGRLYHEFGVGLSLVDCSLLLPAVLDVDDEVTATATEVGPGRFTVRLAVDRGEEVTACRARVRVAIAREHDVADPSPLPGPVAALDHGDPGSPGQDLPLPDGADPAEVLRAAGVGFVWPWRVPYFYCHYSRRVQHSGYVRAMEEVVDRFLADRGISVGRMLDERGWIPVVSRARIRILAEAYLEETMWTTFTVSDILKDVTYDARMDCYVRRGDRLVHVATGSILHGYAVSRGPDAGALARLDEPTVTALTSGVTR